MATTYNIIKAAPDSELGRTLKAARAHGEPVLVDTGEAIYTIVVASSATECDGVFAHSDPQTAIAGLRALQEAFDGVDREQLLRDLREQRAQDSVGRPG